MTHQSCQAANELPYHHSPRQKRSRARSRPQMPVPQDAVLELQMPVPKKK